MDAVESLDYREAGSAGKHCANCGSDAPRWRAVRHSADDRWLCERCYFLRVDRAANRLLFSEGKRLCDTVSQIPPVSGG